MIKRHPLYTDYGADEDGNIYSFNPYYRKTRGCPFKLKLYIDSDGYHTVSVRTARGRLGKYKVVKAHRFVYECYYQKILPSNIDIDHIDFNRLNNKIHNLRELEPQVNCCRRQPGCMRAVRNSYIVYKDGIYQGIMDRFKLYELYNLNEGDIDRWNRGLTSSKMLHLNIIIEKIEMCCVEDVETSSDECKSVGVR